MHRQLRRVIAPAAVLTAALATLGAPPAHAADTSTPHLDRVEDALRRVSPGLEGRVWGRSAGNALAAESGDPAGWLLQTPGCWGDASCAQRAGSRKLLSAMTRDISRAQRTVDISSLAPLPDGAFNEAIADGLRASVAAGHRPKVRILVGAAPLYHANVIPSVYKNDLLDRLGSAADDITLDVASMTTSKTAFSWNHSKLVVVDGESVITGGINDWKGDYLDTSHPVTDVDLALRGPAARTAGAYLDTLWDWTCRNAGNPAKVWLATSGGASCMASLERDANPGPAPDRGTTPVIAVGGLGIGIEDRDPSSSFRLPALTSARDATCFPRVVSDRTNADRDYDTVNPEESALRALIASARDHVEISQQDLNASCPPLPRYDVRLYDTLAARLAAGVKVRIIVSDPANRGLIGSGGYSQIKSLTEISDTLRKRLALVTGGTAAADRAMCANLQLASFRAADSATWGDGEPYALHHKLISVDDSAFYIGSKNLYPSWLQDFGYIVEDGAAAQQLERDLLDPQWKHTRRTATYDYTTGVCPR
ncbi:MULTISPECIES: phospholipase D-like domain-containing protein [unclassified Streptomyces]|uniref:phospholipase D-like domain-containing protein n=1 Tax=unclassified Streptomyces TaxID=2593676 RepID=UPI001F04D605|nr:MULTISPECIES: phospholipase D-like domain-containing protein [unclassified Streptomyces]MCH0566257.1 phospholipase [Streptomyces sp. MUM 2J]MCH0568424.1 phospholipase [Streptomyces sp. MUM 136J]